MFKIKKNKKGFSLLEILISVALLSIFVLGIYGGFNLILKIIFQSRIKILETGVLNEQVEIIRNMSFYDVGIKNGNPVGVLDRVVTTTRNGIDFYITRTIRNIDDEYDGTIDGDPQDTTPADYKLVDLEITCGLVCRQKNPLRFSTFIAPKFLEGDPSHGALFIEVFDADANPVQGADVHVIATSTSSTIDMIDTTDNEGMLRILDLEEGNQIYNITVSKDGYITDRTYTESEVENPAKPPVSVEAQDVTTISFSIDEKSSINLNTINSYCSIVSGVDVNVLGTKLIGITPDVFKVNNNIITDGSGYYFLDNLEWDGYGFKANSYDLIGTIPALPVSILPGVNQDVQLILGSNTSNSLLVSIKDSINNQPISNATIVVSSTSYNSSKITGVGFIRQTDWSGGSGQLLFEDEQKYWSNDFGIDTVDSVGDIKLNFVGENYISNGELESSIFDLGMSVNFVNLIWEPLGQPDDVGENSVRFQIATSNTTTPATWDYLGPNGTSTTYYNDENISISDVHNGDQYLRYKLFLSTDSSLSTPIVSDILITYITSCAAPGQAYFSNLSNEEEYSVSVLADGYQTKTETIPIVSGDIIFDIKLVAE